MIRFDTHWTVDGDNPQALLFEQGYTIVNKVKKHGLNWALMGKEITDDKPIPVHQWPREILNPNTDSSTK